MQLAQDYSYSTTAVSPVLVIIIVAIAVLAIAALWRIFTKAGQPGWASIIPFYNTYILLKIAGRPWWWLILMFFVPFVNLILIIVMYFDIARHFGKGGGFAAGMIFLPIIFFPILAFGSAEYNGPAQPSRLNEPLS